MLVDNAAALIRSKVKSVVGLKYKHTDRPYIAKDDIRIQNEMWESPGLRKLHLETGQAKGMHVMHCVFYPDPNYNIPIFGCDVVETKLMVTAAIADVSPVFGTDEIYDWVQPVANYYRFEENRPLPLWADMFSPACKFMRIKKQSERDDYIELLDEYMDIFIDWVNHTEYDPDWINTMKRLDDQVYYCEQQQKNTKTMAVLSKWFDPVWARDYIDTILFDKPSELQRVGS